jgi:hypothetical protein
MGSRTLFPNVVARGLGKSNPVADNDSATARKLNRRVEMIVSGDVIGARMGAGFSSDTAFPSTPTENPR